MSHATDRLFQAFKTLQAALAAVDAAQRAIPDAEYTQDLPSVVVCSYEPQQKEGTFTLLGTVHHVAGALEHALADPDNLPFREALLEAMLQRVAG